ncbi:MAG: Sir2 family NAD-dependent protein deacetylase [Nannocystaceae bacterium]
MNPRWLPLAARPERYRKVVVLTGAGVSVASGLPSYRGPGGLWESDPALAKALVAGASLDTMWAALGPLRAALMDAVPNAAHRALADYEARLRQGGGELTLITQNVDGLHQRAGSRDVVEYHGALQRSRCLGLCGSFDDPAPHRSTPRCPRCGAPLRPDVVLFDETIGIHEERRAKRALADCDLFMAIGTSGTVWPAASFVRAADYAGARTLYVNLTPLEGAWEAYHEVILGRAEAVLPGLLGAAG